MKLFLILFICAASLFSNEIRVKKNDIVITIDNVKYNLKKGDLKKVSLGSIICFKEGKGRLIINNKKQLSKRTEPCYQIPIGNKEKILDKYIDKTKNYISIAYIDSNEKIKRGVNTRGFKPYQKEKDLLLLKNSIEFVLISKELDLNSKKVFLIDMREKEIIAFETENSGVDAIIINSSLIRSGYKIVIKDNIDNIIFSKRIFKQEDI